jgi:hypothetical protein
VYLLARFEGPPPSGVDPEDHCILLIAETHNQTLLRRWGQFHYSAFSGGDGHAGGRTFHKLFANGTDTAVPPWLYVSAISPTSEVRDVQEFVQSLKNDLLKGFLDKHGIQPKCNLRAPVEMHSVTTGPSSDDPALLKLAATFSHWVAWSERDLDAASECAGVYVLAHFDGTPPPVVDALDQRIVYIGETCENTLAGRTSQFNRSAFHGKDGHSGGWSYRSRIGGNGEALYVAFCAIGSIGEPFRSAYIRHVERDLIWRYVRRFGRRPLCNSK